MKKIVVKAREFFASLLVAFSVLGCVLGAGFLSGAEIYSFFVRFGYYGIVGSIVCAVVFGCIVYFVARQNYCECNAKYQQNSDGYNAQSSNNILMQACGLIIAATMIAGTNKILNGFGCNIFVSNIVVFLCLLAALIFGLKFAKAVNIAVTSLALIFVIIIIATSRLDIKNSAVLSTQIDVNIFSLVSAICLAISYAAMNAISSYTIISGIAHGVKNGGKSCPDVGRRCLNISVLCGIILGWLVLLIYWAITTNSAIGEMPMLGLVKSKFVYIMYSALLVVAMLSTLFSCAIGGQKLFSKKWGKLGSCLVVSMLCQAISFVGFSNLIKYGYPIIGAIVVAKFVVKICIKIKNKRQENVILKI